MKNYSVAIGFDERQHIADHFTAADDKAALQHARDFYENNSGEGYNGQIIDLVNEDSGECVAELVDLEDQAPPSIPNILVIIAGGIVEDVIFYGAGAGVEVRDYDVDGLDHKDLEVDEHRARFRRYRQASVSNPQQEG